MSIEQTEAESAAVAKNQDGRVSLADIKAAIAQEYYSPLGPLFDGDTAPGNNPTISSDSPLHRMTIVVLVMNNGFVIIGKAAPLDPANFNADLGKKFAYEDAIRQLWPLMAFARASNND